MPHTHFTVSPITNTVFYYVALALYCKKFFDVDKEVDLKISQSVTSETAGSLVV